MDMDHLAFRFLRKILKISTNWIFAFSCRQKSLPTFKAIRKSRHYLIVAAELRNQILVEIEVIDTDGDGIPDADDQCSNSDTSPTVVIDGCDSGVSNFMIGDTGCFVADLIAECAANAGNHGDFVSSISEVTNTLKKAGLLSGKEKGAIQSCAAKSALP